MVILMKHMKNKNILIKFKFSRIVSGCQKVKSLPSSVANRVLKIHMNIYILNQLQGNFKREKMSVFIAFYGIKQAINANYLF